MPYPSHAASSKDSDMLVLTNGKHLLEVTQMLTRVAILLPISCCLALSQTAKIEHPWDSSFQKSGNAWVQGDFAARRSHAEQGWAAVQRAGPSATDYPEGVELAYTVFENSQGTLAAEVAYRDALAATVAGVYRQVHLELLLRRMLRSRGNQVLQGRRFHRMR